MNLHTNKELFQDAILATAEHLGIREIYVEKDYWVTVALFEIFHSKGASQSVCKGGTSLSKCYKLIERFSEDIDIVVLHKENESDNQLKKKIRHIYDIHQMLKDEKINIFFYSNEFEEMLVKVGNEDKRNFRTNNDWVFDHPYAALIFNVPMETWKQLSAVYNTAFRDLVTGILPDEKKVILTLEQIGKRLQKITWNIERE